MHRLALLYRELAEETQHGAGLVQRDADHIRQECQHDQNFNAKFTAWRNARDVPLFASGGAKYTIADEYGAAILQSPHHPLADQPAIIGPGIWRKNVQDRLGFGKFQACRAPAG
jgi:hypothetical protein